eukprot:8955946-Pyramimonas_sp.AAC.2
MFEQCLNTLPVLKRKVNLSAFAFLFSELVQYSQQRVTSVSDLEHRLEEVGYRVGTRILELLCYREKVCTMSPLRLLNCMTNPPTALLRERGPLQNTLLVLLGQRVIAARHGYWASLTLCTTPSGGASLARCVHTYQQSKHDG